MEWISETQNIPILEQYDVIVLGGGVAGCAAAVAAARAGSSVLLLEKMTVLGGLATAGHVVYYLPLCDGCGNKMAAGLAEELLQLSISMEPMTCRRNGVADRSIQLLPDAMLPLFWQEILLLNWSD